MLDKLYKLIVFAKEHIVKVVMQRTDKVFWTCISVCIITLILSLLIDCCFNFKKTEDAGIELQIENVYICVVDESKENDLELNVGDFCSMVLTIDTILAASVIFFYSMIDNRKTGIPHRTIIKYTFGSFMVPGLFFCTILLLPIMYTASSMEMVCTTWASIFFSYIFQLLILLVILFSTSYDFSINAVCCAEMEQFELMVKHGLEQNNNEKLKQIRHMEQVVLSDDLSIEKVKMIKALLKVPFYEKKYFWIIGIDPKILCDLKEEYLYNYYYTNLNSVFYQIKDKLQECQKVYDILYDFFDELYELCAICREERLDDEKAKKVTENCRVVVAAIFNAATEANSKNVIQFVNQVLDKERQYDSKIIEKNSGNDNTKNKEMLLHNKQVSLYLCYLQFLFYVYEQSSSEGEYQVLEGDKWEPDIIADIEYYERHWKMWKRQVTLSQRDSCFYFWSTISVAKGAILDDSPLCFILNKKKGYGSTNDS